MLITFGPHCEKFKLISFIQYVFLYNDSLDCSFENFAWGKSTLENLFGYFYWTSKIDSGEFFWLLLLDFENRLWRIVSDTFIGLRKPTLANIFGYFYWTSIFTWKFVIRETKRERERERESKRKLM